MSKERLEEIQREVNYAYRRDGSINTKAVTMHIEHYEYLYEQSERVQELERVNKQLKNNLSVYKGYYKNMIKINEDVVEENKKYREAIDRAIREGIEIEDCNKAIDQIYGILGIALEESE